MSWIAYRLAVSMLMIAGAFDLLLLIRGSKASVPSDAYLMVVIVFLIAIYHKLDERKG